jgi:transposase
MYGNSLGSDPVAKAARKTASKKVRPAARLRGLGAASSRGGEVVGQGDAPDRGGPSVGRVPAERVALVRLAGTRCRRAGGGRTRRAALLTDEQRTQLDTELRRGPSEHGYATELWTLGRVAEVIEKTTGVRYHPGHVWRLLTELGWTRQRPAGAPWNATRRRSPAG